MAIISKISRHTTLRTFQFLRMLGTIIAYAVWRAYFNTIIAIGPIVTFWEKTFNLICQHLSMFIAWKIKIWSFIFSLFLCNSEWFTNRTVTSSPSRFTTIRTSHNLWELVTQGIFAIHGAHLLTIHSIWSILTFCNHNDHYL